MRPQRRPEQQPAAGQVEWEEFSRHEIVEAEHLVVTRKVRESRMGARMGNHTSAAPAPARNPGERIIFMHLFTLQFEVEDGIG